MIFTNKGITTVQGTASEVLSDFSVIVSSLNEMLTEDVGAENARKMIKESFELGFLSEDEITAKHKQALEQALKELLLKGLV